MPALARPIADERDGLLLFLNQARDALRAAVYELSHEQATSRPTSSTLSVAGLVKHAALTEQYWMVNVVGEHEPEEGESWEERFRLGPGETVEGWLDRYDGVARETAAIVARIANLDHPVPIPPGKPWFPKDVSHWSLRWVLLHLIQETTRHAGHADIIREAIDGANAFELIGRAEAAGWPYLRPA